MGWGDNFGVPNLQGLFQDSRGGDPSGLYNIHGAWQEALSRILGSTPFDNNVSGASSPMSYGAGAATTNNYNFAPPPAPQAEPAPATGAPAPPVIGDFGPPAPVQAPPQESRYDQLRKEQDEYNRTHGAGGGGGSPGYHYAGEISGFSDGMTFNGLSGGIF